MSARPAPGSSETYEDLAVSFLLDVLKQAPEAAVLPQPLDLSSLSDKERAVIDLLLARAARRALTAGSTLVPADPGEVCDKADSEVSQDLAEPGKVDPHDAREVLDRDVTPEPTGDMTTPGPADDISASAAAPERPTLNTPPAGVLADKENEMIYGPGGIPKVGADAKPAPQRISLKNGRTRAPYQGRIEGFDRVFLKSDGGSGLKVSPSGEVTGENLAAGDYTLVLAVSKAGVAQAELHARVSIIHDPRDLWTSLPSDQAAPNAKPDAAFARIDAPAALVAASLRGRSHAKEGGYRDDHFMIHFDAPSGWHMLIVADGAGSAPMSREGSRVACETTLESLQELLPAHREDLSLALAQDEDRRESALGRIFYSILPRAALDAAHSVAARAAELERPASDFATTLVIFVSQHSDAGWVSASFTVGDGGAAIWDDAEQEVRVMCRPDSGEFAGQTRFLSTSEFENAADLKARLFVDIRSRFTAAFALTDGITDPKFPTDTIFADPGAWADFWRKDFGQIDLTSETLETDLLDWMGFWSRGNHDDRTLAVMVLEPWSAAPVTERAEAGEITDPSQHAAEDVRSGMAEESWQTPGEANPEETPNQTRDASCTAHPEGTDSATNEWSGEEER